MKNWKTKEQTNILISLLINFIFLLAALIFCDFKYEVSDDFVMASILSGSFGDSLNPHLMFANAIWGYALMPLYELFPGISWYFVAQIILIFVSAIIITFLLFEKIDQYKALIITLLFILCFVNDAYILVQFTKTAILATMSGSLLFLWALFEEKNIWYELFGGFICLAGSALRFSVIYIAGGFLLFILSYEVVKYIRHYNSNKKCNRHLLRIIMSGAILIGCAYGLKYANCYYYSQDASYNYFSKYSSARAGIVDYDDKGYETYQEELKALGISENDYEMLISWNFADPEVFTLDQMQQIQDIIQKHYQNKEIHLKEILERINTRPYWKYPMVIGCEILLFLLILFNTKKCWTTLINIGIGSIYIAYFAIRERMIYRVEYAVFLSVFLCSLYFLDNRDIPLMIIDKKMQSRICMGLGVLIFLYQGRLYIPDQDYRHVSAEMRKSYIEEVFYASWHYDARKFRRNVNYHNESNALLEEIENNKQNYYFLDFNTTIQTLYYEWSPWYTLPVGYFDNVNYLAGVTTNFPDVVESMEEAGISNPLKDLTKSNIYLVDNSGIETKITYLQEHYYPNAYAELYKEIDGYQIWKIYEE